ncbi:MAG: hypothetical protein KDE33_15465 [Bacteroidetes bacterium]|nr:hypothetical protein [Bacteroidota bacterium]
MKNSDKIPLNVIMSSNTPWNSILSDFIKKHNLEGNITFGQIESLDKELSDRLKKFVSSESYRQWEKYTHAGANKERLKDNKTLKAKREKAKQKRIAKQELEKKIKKLLKTEISALKPRQIIEIIKHAELEFNKLEPYYDRLNELKKIPVNYNKVDDIKKAKGLVTQYFAGKSNPLSLIEFEEIILARLYCAKKGLEYLKKKDKKVYDEVWEIAGPKINEVLDKKNYKSLDDINF